MDYNDSLSITEKAKNVLKKYELDSAPINIEKICKAENIEIIRTDLSDLEKESNRQISGVIYLDYQDGKKIQQILINDNDIEPRQKFTIAHELGHYFLHVDPNDTLHTMISFRGAKNRREKEADIFAAELLMPKKLVEKEYESLPFPTASFLANVFGVSKLAMQYRLNEMGLNYIG